MSRKPMEYRVAVPTLLYLSVIASSEMEARDSAIAVIDSELPLEDGLSLACHFESKAHRPRLYYGGSSLTSEKPCRDGITIEDIAEIT